jgi:hypothetical protein
MGKTFKDYYQDEEYRKKHLEYMKTPILCACGCAVPRCQMTVHKKTDKHKKLIIVRLIDEANSLIEEMKKPYQKLQLIRIYK